MIGRRTIGAVLALAAAMAAMPAGAQGERFWRMEYNSVRLQVDKSVTRSNELRDQLRHVADNATGCRLSRSLRSTLMDIQVEAEKLANAAAQLGADEQHRAAVDMHNLALEERKRMESGILVQCAELGL